MSLFRYESESNRQRREYDERQRRITVFLACLLIALILLLCHKAHEAGGWSVILNYIR